MTELYIDVSSIEALDFDLEIPCECRGEYWVWPNWSCMGENVAEWMIVTSCCGITQLRCDRCHTNRVTLPYPHRLRCVCGVSHYPAEAYSQIIRIKDVGK